MNADSAFIVARLRALRRAKGPEVAAREARQMQSNGLLCMAGWREVTRLATMWERMVVKP